MTLSKTIASVSATAAAVMLIAGPVAARPHGHGRQVKVCKTERHHGKRVKTCRWVRR